MARQNPSAPDVDCSDVVSLPYALSESNGLIFELHEGGQPRRKHQIPWVRLKPTEVPDKGASDDLLFR
ncbi:MAG TPA: hypothetical protein VFP59_19665 [Candidatus Angelobacter sp.]|nr:hypothetical protein [Candidatus Angelobacter sp.]